VFASHPFLASCALVLVGLPSTGNTSGDLLRARIRYKILRSVVVFIDRRLVSFSLNRDTQVPVDVFAFDSGRMYIADSATFRLQSSYADAAEPHSVGRDRASTTSLFDPPSTNLDRHRFARRAPIDNYISTVEIFPTHYRGIFCVKANTEADIVRAVVCFPAVLQTRIMSPALVESRNVGVSLHSSYDSRQPASENHNRFRFVFNFEPPL